MFLLYAVAIGLVLAVALGGRLERLGALTLRWPWVAIAGLLVQVVLFLPSVGARLGSVAPAVYVASTVVVFAFVLANIGVPGFAVIALGAASNLAAIVANGGYMPASPAALASLGEAPARGYSNSVAAVNPMLGALTDVFALPAWLPFANVFSIGDILIALGVVLALVRIARPDLGSAWRRPAALRRGNSTE